MNSDALGAELEQQIDKLSNQTETLRRLVLVLGALAAPLALTNVAVIVGAGAIGLLGLVGWGGRGRREKERLTKRLDELQNSLSVERLRELRSKLDDIVSTPGVLRTPK